MGDKEKSKILMYGKHFAYIDKDLMMAFDINCRVVNFSAWIRENALKDFDILIKSSSDICDLDKKITKYYYSDKTEWLREKMRNEIVKNNKGGCI